MNGKRGEADEHGCIPCYRGHCERLGCLCVESDEDEEDLVRGPTQTEHDGDDDHRLDYRNLILLVHLFQIPVRVDEHLGALTHDDDDSPITKDEDQQRTQVENHE